MKCNEERVLYCAKEVKFLAHPIKKRKIMIKVMRVLEEEEEEGCLVRAKRYRDARQI